MSTNFLDTSALAKRYLSERGSASIRALAAEAIAISSIAFVEMASILNRLNQDGDITAEERDRIYALFVADTSGFTIVDVSEGVVGSASRLAFFAGSRLRSLDALQLASAQVVLTTADPGLERGAFISADKALLAAARQVGLAAQNPEDYE